MAVLILMYREQMLPCCPKPSPRLLGGESLTGAVKMRRSSEQANVSTTELHEPTGKIQLHLALCSDWLQHGAQKNSLIISKVKLKKSK